MNQLAFFVILILIVPTIQLQTEATGRTEQTFSIEGRSRKYIFYSPDDLPPNAPLVFALHGYGGSAKDMKEFSGMDKVAYKNKFAVCYPQGNLGEDKKNSWNAGYSNDNVNDVEFLSELAMFLQKKHNLSKQNTFCTGMSNGADMCYVLVCSRSDVFSAIAPVAGCMMESTINNCVAPTGIPVFEIHGTDDDITLWMGDPNYSEKYGAYIGTQTVVDFWIKKNECSETVRELLTDINKSDNSFIVAEKNINHSTNNQVWLYTLVGGKHDWPGAWGNMDIVASEEIWNFFRQFLK